MPSALILKPFSYFGLGHLMFIEEKNSAYLPNIKKVSQKHPVDYFSTTYNITCFIKNEIRFF